MWLPRAFLSGDRGGIGGYYAGTIARRVPLQSGHTRPVSSKPPTPSLPQEGGWGWEVLACRQWRGALALPEAQVRPLRGGQGRWGRPQPLLDRAVEVVIPPRVDDQGDGARQRVVA